MSLARRYWTLGTAIVLAVLLTFGILSLSPTGPSENSEHPGHSHEGGEVGLVKSAGADKVCSNNHHHHFRTVDSVVRDVHWYAKVYQSGPNVRKDWYSGLKAHENGGTYQGYRLC